MSIKCIDHFFDILKNRESKGKSKRKSKQKNKKAIMGDLYDRPTGDDFTVGDINSKHVFIQKVYAILLLMLSLTVAVSAIFMSVDSVKDWLNDNATLIYVLVIIVMFGSMIAIMCIPQCRYVMPLNIIMLFIFTLSVSVLVGMVTIHYDTNIVLLAFGATAFITIGLSLFACQTTYDFTSWAPYMMVVLLALIFLGIINIFVHNQVLNTVYASFGALVFSIYIIIDTQMIIGGEHKYSIGPEDHIFAAISLYLDIVNLFLYLLSLLGDRN